MSKPVQMMQLFEITQLPQMTPTGWNGQLPQMAQLPQMTQPAQMSKLV